MDLDEPAPWFAQASNCLLVPSSFSTPSLGVAAPVLCPVLALDNETQHNKAITPS